MSDGIDFPNQAVKRESLSLALHRFDPTERDWVELASVKTAEHADSLTLVTFNTWFQGADANLRYAGLLDCLRQCDADIVVLQETTVALLEVLLSAQWIRERYAYARAPFRADAIPSHGLMILSRLPMDRVMLHPLPTHMGRWLLIATLNLNGAPFAIATVHLESMKAYGDVRGEQLRHTFQLLENSPNALLAGDFNFCSSWLEENSRIDPRYIDLWPALRPGEPGYTQDTDINLMLAAAKREVKKVRFDRVLLRRAAGAMQWAPANIELIGTGPVNSRFRKIFPSDHFGMRATIARQSVSD